MIQSTTNTIAAETTHTAETVIQGAHHALDKLQNGVDDLAAAGPAALSRAAAQMEELTRRTLARASEASQQVRARALRAGDATVGYIKDEPVKAVLIAVAAGAVAAGLCAWLSRSNKA